ncbi:ABC transporter ATP-binding protein [Anaerosinus gibii]|uniref:ABC transporter ATP-binding protein n=1 Tax=Selenobaculum gibii TaxID=3054208 RepID=A0A9Y2AHT7_9FIRM|nr:ABC transporter ATP-binding protein [Selenobaculum gbiensis]WIW71079.1 ABC transporter ATP-binding protein [Selenobaculum gbiensis]
MKDIFKIFTIFTPKQQRYCGVIVFCMVIGAMLEAVGIGAILPLISIMGDEGFLDKHIVVKQYAEILNITTHTSFIIFSSALLIILYVLKNLYMAWLTKLQINFSTQNQIVYAEGLLEGYISKPYLYHLDQNSATLLRNVSSGPILIFTGILIPTFTLLTEAITAVTIWSMLILVDAFTAIIVAGLLGAMMYAILKTFRKKIAKRGEVQNKYSALYMKWLNQGLGAIKETKVLRKEKYFLDEFVGAYQKYGQANGDFNFINQLPRMFIETMVTSTLLILIIVKLMMGIQPMEIVPILGVLALAAFRLMPCANRIVNLSNGIKFQMPLFNLLYDELIAIKERKLQYEAKTCEEKEQLGFNKEIKVEKLTFRYPQGKKEVLKQISFSIPKGCFVGIVGQSGAGKTTFVDIMLGLLNPSNGKILVDSVDIFENIRAWQANLSYVPQSIYLIDGSIRENIALGIPEQEIDDDKIDKVLKMAELYEFVEELPEKSYTYVGERGVKLSGGQRQRIGIARALYYEPEVLILDEATSALDNETEKSITHTILKLKGQITIIAIAHRVSTLEECDFKIKFNEGQVERI